MNNVVARNRLRTRTAQPRQIERRWHLIDAQGKILGRTATQVAELLSGRRKATWSPMADVGDNVIVINTTGVRLTGRKADQKVYYKHTTYLGHLKATPFQRMQERRPSEVVRHAVFGMLPRTRKRAGMIRRLHLYTGSEHPYAAKLTNAKA